MAPLLLMGWSLAVAASAPEAERFLEAASAASTAPDRRACLAAVASLGATEGLPADLSDEAAGLRRATPGGLRLYADIEASRVRIGKVDPFGVVGRIEVRFLPDGGAPILLPALDETTRVLPPGARGALEIIARDRDCVPGAVLMRTRVPVGTGAPPSLPPPPSSAPRAVTSPELRIAPAEARAPAFAWWWYVALGVAVAGAGLAVWEETR